MKKYVLLTGGQLYNKGAQAMTFIVVDEIAKRFPDLSVVLVSSNDYERSIEERNNLKFDIVPQPQFATLESVLLTKGITRRTYLSLNKNLNLNTIRHILDHSAFMIDISGYALGSNWGISSAVYYSIMILLAKTMKVPVYVFPQSFGPFDYKGFRGKYVMNVLNNSLRYPNVIMARETEGKDSLIEFFKLDNVIKTPDMVLLEKEIDLSNIYNKVPQLCVHNIKLPAIGVIPNAQNLKYGNREELDALYISLIDRVLEYGKNVYLIYHSAEDKTLCEEIKAKFIDNSFVHYIDQELSFFEFESIVKHFDYVIASRYHSVILSYKNYVPAIILGWATKYTELAESVGQEQFVFDVRNSLNLDEFNTVLSNIENTHNNQSHTIKAELESIRHINLFDYIDY